MNVENIIKDFNSGSIRILTKEEELILFAYLVDNPDKKEIIQTILLQANQGLIMSIAKKYRPLGDIEFDDIIQYGNMGLLKAIDKFDCNRDTKFSSYATFWIKQSINRGLQKIVQNVSMPIRVAEIRRKYFEVEHELQVKYNRDISFYEVANKLGMNYTDLLLIFTFSQNNIVRLNNEVNGDKEMIDFIVDESGEIEKDLGERKQLILEAFKELNDKEREVILYRYGYHDSNYHTMDDVAKHLDVSRQRVYQIENSALRTMKRYIKQNN